MEGVSLGSLYLELGLDTEQFYVDMENARVTMLNSLKDVNLGVKVGVDDRALYGLNDHLSLKEKHIDRLNQKVIRPQVDLSGLNALEDKLDSLSNKSLGVIRPQVDMSGLDALEVRLDRFENRVSKAKVGIDAEFNENSHSAESTSNKNADKLSGDLKEIKQAIEKPSGPGVIGGLVGGIGQQFGFLIGSQLINSLKREFGLDVKKMTAGAVQTAAAPIKFFITENPRLKAEVDRIGELVETRLRKSFYKIGDGLVAVIENELNKAPDKIKPSNWKIFKKEAIDDGEIISQFQALKTEVQSEFESLKLLDIMLPQQELEARVNKLGEALKQYRELAIQERAIPQVKERAAEILNSTEGLDPASRKVSNTGATVTEGTQELVITIGGYAAFGGLSGKRLPGEINAELPPTSKAIWVKNEDSDIPRSVRDKDANAEQIALLGSLAKPNLRGYSKDAVEMAAQAMAALEKNPEITIKFLGESGGGFAAEEAYKILKMMGIENVQYLGVGTPDLAGRLTDEGKIISPDERLGVAAHQKLGRFGLYNTSAASQNILGIEEHEFEGYNELKLAELQNFLKGAPNKLKPEEIERLKTDTQQFTGQNIEGLSRAKLRGISEDAFSKWQESRRHLLSGIYDANDLEGLKEVDALYRKFYLRTVRETERFQNLRSRFEGALGTYESVSRSPSVMSDSDIKTAIAELNKLKQDLAETYGSEIGTMGEKVKELDQQISELIGMFQDPKLLVKKETDLQSNSRQLVEKIDEFVGQLDATFSNLGGVEDLDRLIETLDDNLREVDQQVKVLDHLVGGKIGAHFDRYASLADALRMYSDLLRQDQTSLEVARLDEVVRGNGDIFQPPSLKEESYAAYQKSQLAKLDQTERYRAFIPDPWLDPKNNKEDAKRLKEAANEFKKGKREAQIEQVKETVQTGLSWIDRMRGKRKGQTQEVDGALVVAEESTGLTKFGEQVGEATTKLAIKVLGIAEPLAVRRINQLLARTPGEKDVITLNPRRIEKLSDLTPEDMRHLSMLGASDLGGGIGAILSNPLTQGAARLIGSGTRGVIRGGLQGAVQGYNTLRGVENALMPAIPFGGLAKAGIQKVVLPIAAGVAAANLPGGHEAMEVAQGAISNVLALPGNMAAGGIGSQVTEIVQSLLNAGQLGPENIAKLRELAEVLQRVPVAGANAAESIRSVLTALESAPGALGESVRQIIQLLSSGAGAAGAAALTPYATGKLLGAASNKAKDAVLDAFEVDQERPLSLPPAKMRHLQPEMVEVLPATSQPKAALPSKGELVPTQKADLSTTGQQFKDAARATGEFAGKAYAAGVQAVESFKGAIRDLNEVYQYVEKAFAGFKSANEELARLAAEYKKGNADFTRLETQLEVIRKVRDIAKTEFLKIREDLASTGQIRETVTNKEGNQVGIGAVLAGRLGNIGTQARKAEDLVAYARKMKPEEVHGPVIDVKATAIGNNIINAEAQAIASNNAAKKAAKDSAEGVIDVTEQTFEIKSPSRVFQRIGQMLGLGLKKGMEEEIPVEMGGLKQKAVSEAKSYVDAFTKGLAQLGINIPKAFEAGVDKAPAVLNKLPAMVGNTAKNVLSNLGSYIKGGIAFYFASQLIPQLQKVTSESLEAAMNLDRLKVALNFATGGKGADSLKFITDQAIAMNAPLAQAREGYKQLAAATRGTRIDRTTTENLALGINQAGAALGMSPEQQERAFTAIAQMAQKGKVQAEELRGQLAETGISFQIAADAMGVSTAELNKMLELGQVTADEFLPKLGSQLRKEFGGAAEEAANTAQGAMNKFNNQTRLASEGFGKLIQPAQVALLNAGAGALKLAADNAWLLGAAVGALAIGVGTALAPAIRTTIVHLGKLLGLTITTAGGMNLLRTAMIATAKAALPMMAIAAGLYAIGQAMKYILPDETTSRMEGFTDRTIKGLDEIAKAAAKARGEVEKIPQPKGGRIKEKGSWWDWMVSTDIFGKEIAPNKDSTGKFSGDNPRTAAEQQYNRQLDAARQQTDLARSLLNDQLAKGILKSSSGADLSIQGTIDQVKQSDQVVRDLQTKRDILKGQPTVDKQQVQEVERQIEEAAKKRAEQAEPLIKARQTVQGQLKNIDSMIKSNAEQYANNPEELARLNGELETQKRILEQNLRVLDAFDKQLGGAIDPVRALQMAFSKMNSDLEEMEGRINRAFNQKQLQNAENQLAGWSTNQFNSTESAVANATAERDRARDMAAETERIINEARGKISSPTNKKVLSGLTNDRGESITESSTNRDIDEARLKLDEKDPRRKILDDLKDYKKSLDKLPELKAQAKQAEFRVKEAVQAAELAKVADRTATREAKITRTEAVQRGDQAMARARLSLRKASGQIDAEDAAIVGADQSIRDAGNAKSIAGQRLASVQAEIKDIEGLKKKGILSQEEYVKRIRELRTQEIQAGAAVKEAESQRIEAQAQKLEAYHAKLKADFDFRKQLRDNAITRDEATAQANTALRKASGVITAEQATVENAESAKKSAFAKVDAIRTEMAETQKLRKAGAMSQREYLRAMDNLRTQEAQADASAKQAEAQRIEAIQAKLRADFEFRKQLKEAEINLSATKQKGAISSVMMDPNAGPETAEQVGRSQALVDSAADSQRIGELQSQISEIAALRAKGALTEKEATQQTKQATQEIANLQSQIQDRQIAAAQALKKSREELIDAEFDHAKKLIDFRQEELKILGDQLSRQKDMAATLYEAQKVTLEGQAKYYETQIKVYDLAKSAAEELNQLKPGAIQTPSQGERKQTTIAALEQVLRNLAQYTGMPMNSTKDMAIGKAQAEDRLAEIQGRMLEADMAYAQQQLALDIESNLMQAEGLKLQAETLKIAAAQYQEQVTRNRLDLELAKNTAVQTGDKTGVEIINNKLAANSLRQDEADRMKVGAFAAGLNAEAMKASVLERGDIQKQTLTEKQGYQAQEFNANEFLRKNNQIRDLGKEGVRLDEMPGGMATVRPPSADRMNELNGIQNDLGRTNTTTVLSSGFNSVSNSINNLSKSIMSLAEKAGIPRSQTNIYSSEGDRSGKTQRDSAVMNAKRRGI